MKNTLAFLVFVALAMTACVENVTLNCCQNQPLEVQVDSFYFVVSNVASANGDGINDGLGLLSNGGSDMENVFEYVRYQVVDGSKLLYERDCIHDFCFWDCRINGKVKTGFYDYKLILKPKGESEVIHRGTACVFTDDCPADIENCRFATQFDGKKFDTNLPSFECF